MISEATRSTPLFQYSERLQILRELLTNMAYRSVAIVGAGMTKFMRRALETPKELAWLAAKSRAGLRRDETGSNRRRRSRQRA